LTLLFTLFFILSNLIFLPFYYRSEKQDFRGLARYLKTNLQPGDVLFDATINMGRMPGLFHYLGVLPENRSYRHSYRVLPDGTREFRISFMYQGSVYTLYHSRFCCDEFLQQGKRVWMIVGDKGLARNLQKDYPCVLKGYFDGSVLNLHRFPTDASMYLFLWEPGAPNDKGIDLLIE